MKRTWVKHNDVLINITGASIGRIAFFGCQDDSANVNQHVCIIRPKQKLINHVFLTYFIGNENHQKMILSKNAGATRQAFNFEQIKSFKIFVPPIEKQKEFEVISTQVEKTKIESQKSLFEMGNSFNALLQRAFRGEGM